MHSCTYLNASIEPEDNLGIDPWALSNPFKDSFSLGLTWLGALPSYLGLCPSWLLHGLGELDSGSMLT